MKKMRKQKAKKVQVVLVYTGLEYESLRDEALDMARDLQAKIGAEA